MDVCKSLHDFLRWLYVFLEPLFSILAWFVDQGYLLGCSLTQWVKVRITKQAPAHRNKRVKSSDLKCGRFLGEGCTGIIYEATWSRRRSISSLARKAFPAVPADVFEYEAARLVELDHPNIVKVLGWTVDRRSCSLVMDHMKYDLFSVVEKRKEATLKNGAQVNFGSTVPIPMREAVHIISQIAEGMKYVHDQRLAHGDLKPNNVLVDSESGLMLVKVADFGLTETKKRSITLVSHQTRCLQILKWKAPELFENLLGSSTESDSENMWTEMFPDLEVVKMAHATSSGTMGSAKSKMQLADVYSFGLTCSYILGAQVPQDSNLGLLELRNGISSGARPQLPFECPQRLASLISASWDTIPLRRPAFIDICKKLQIVKWELKQHEEKVQEYRNPKPQGSRKGGLANLTISFSKGGKKTSLNVIFNKYRSLKTAAVDYVHESTTGNTLLISKEIQDHVPQLRHHMFSTMARALSEVELSTRTWSGYLEPNRDEYHQDLREELEKLKAHTEWGHFFFDFNGSGLEMKKGKFAEGSQAVLYEGEWKRDDGKSHSVAIKALKMRRDVRITETLMHFFNSKGTEANPRTSRVLRPLGGTLLKNGRLALVYEKCWGDLHKLIDFQMLKNTDVEMPPFNQEMAIDIMLQIAEGLAELHEFGILHRDVKSLNVLVRDLEQFSLGGNHGFISCALIDYEFGFLGTGFWRAPEILEGLKLRIGSKIEFTPAMDVYSYGMTCSEILTGKLPFQNEGLYNYDVVLCGRRPELPASVHPQLSDLVGRCWHANPLKRPTFQEIVLLLKNIPTGK